MFINKLILDPSEIGEVRWSKLSEIQQAAVKEPSKFVRAFAEEVPRRQIIDAIEKHLSA